MSPPVFICLLGSFRLLRAGRPIPIRPGGKHEAFLSTLALRPGIRLPRDTLLEILWPDTRFALAVQSLNSLVYSLNKMLSDAIGGESPVLHPDGSYYLNLQAGVEVDVMAFDRLAQTGQEHSRSGRLEDAALAYRRAVDLYSGDLCSAGHVNAVVERERLRALFHTLLARLAGHEYDNADYSRALDFSLQLLTSDPTREDAHRMAMRCYVRRGERSEALRQYRLCVNILHAEFEARPEAATVALFERVRDDPDSV